jgi:hypothetical protein
LGKRCEGRDRTLYFHISSIIEIIKMSRHAMSVAIRCFPQASIDLSNMRGVNSSFVLCWRNFVKNS